MSERQFTSYDEHEFIPMSGKPDGFRPMPASPFRPMGNEPDRFIAMTDRRVSTILADIARGAESA